MEIPTAAILKNPDLYEKVKNDLRYSDDGMSRNEAQEYERTRDEQNRADIDAAASAMRTVQEAGEKAERIRDGLRTQFEALGHKKVGKREAEFYSTIWTAAIANEARYAGVDIEEMARRWNLRFQYDRGTGDVRRMRGVYSQPINEGVDPKAEVGIVDVDLGQYTAAQLSTPQELLQYIKSLIGKESMLSRDSKALLGISSNSNAKHLVRSAKPTDTFKEQDARNAALLSIEDIVKNSVLIESFPNRNSKKKHLKNVHRLYVPLRIGDELHTLRVVAHETQDKSGLVPIRADLFDLIVEKESSRPSSDSLSGSTLSSAPPVPTKTGVSTVTIADMLRGVKDAEGRPYVGEEYQQSSARQSEEYDPGDPKTWPEGSARDEALALEAWQNLENDDEVETWPESPEKTEALALRKEYGEIEAWVESHTVEEVLANDELNERGVAIEERLRDLRRTLRKKKPKGAERRLLQLIEAEEEAAAREAETYYQSAYQRQAEEKLAQDEKAWAETVDNFMAGKLIHNRQVRVMTTPIALILAADEGSGFKEIVTTPRILNKILKQKHIDVTPEILKQLPRAMADPILVFKSATVPGSYVSMLELKDERGGTIVVPVALNASKPGEPAFMTSAYGKGSAVEVSDQWFAEQVESGNLRYMNTKKSALWAEDVGLQLPIMSRQPEALHELNIPTEADLVKARGENPGYYQRHSPLTFKLTGKPVSGEYMAVLEKLEAGEPVAADEYNAIPEIQDARSRTATGSTLGMPGREGLRKQVYDKLMSYGSAVTEVVDGRERTVYNGEVRNDRRADIIIGLPASGKSSALVDPISNKYKSMLIDSDEAKKLIPEFDDGFGAGFVHEESKEIVSFVLSTAIDEGKNVVIPIVGSSYTKLKGEYVDYLRQKGYKVYVHMADINPNVAAGRNLRRFAETGRFVDLGATSFKYGNKPREVFERVKKEGTADGYSRIDTTVFPGRQVEGTEDISYDRGDLREGRGGVLADVEKSGEAKRSWAAPAGAVELSGVFGSTEEGRGAQAGAAGGGRRAAEKLGAERTGGTSREGTAPRSVSGRGGDINGRLTVQPDGVSLIEFFKNANRSTSFHELAHHMFRVIYELSGRKSVDPQLIEDVDTILREAGVTREEFESDNAEVRKAARTRVHEFFAEGFEVYISEGKAPSKELRGVFRRLRAWMLEVYHDVVQALGIELSDEMRGVYDRLLAMPEEIDAETTIRELAVEEAVLKEEIQRHEAEMREWEAQEQISAEGGEEWASLEIPESAMEAVDGWLSELESYEIGRAARAEVRKTLDYIREEGGLNFDRLVHLMGDEAAGELRKKLGNFYFTSKKALAEGRGLPLDVLAEALGMDENVCKTHLPRITAT